MFSIPLIQFSSQCLFENVMKHCLSYLVFPFNASCVYPDTKSRSLFIIYRYFIHHQGQKVESGKKPNQRDQSKPKFTLKGEQEKFHDSVKALCRLATKMHNTIDTAVSSCQRKLLTFFFFFLSREPNLKFRQCLQKTFAQLNNAIPKKKNDI